MLLPFRALAMLILLVAMGSLVTAQTAELPACGAQCLKEGLSNSTCDPTDTRCTCADQAFQDYVSSCTVQSCTIKEGLTSRNISSTMCNLPMRDRGHLSDTLTSVFMSLAIASMLVRCVELGWQFGRPFGRQFDRDDVFAILTFVTALPMGIIMYFMSKSGYGKDLWTIPFDNITLILKYTYVVQVLYIASISSLKLAFLFLYLRIFMSGAIHKAAYVLMGIVVAFFLAFFFGIVFNCLPISYNWTKWTGETEGRCLNFNAFGISCAVINILLDLVVLVIPLREITKLNMSWARKVLVMLMLGTGIFVIIVSILRLTVIIDFAQTTNPTYDNVPTSYWSVIECFTGVLCFNMPSIRRVFNKLFSWCRGTNMSTNTRPSDSPARVTKYQPRRRPLGASSLKSEDDTMGTETGASARAAGLHDYNKDDGYGYGYAVTVGTGLEPKSGSGSGNATRSGSRTTCEGAESMGMETDAMQLVQMDPR